MRGDQNRHEARHRTMDIGLLALVVTLAALTYPLRRYMIEPERQRLLGRREPPGRRLALCSQYGFATSAGVSLRMLPGRPARELSDLPGEAVTLILGGFRGPYVVYQWIQVEEEKRRKIHFDLIDRYTTIATLQSDYPETWIFHAWNLAWNIPVQWESLPRKYDWIRRAIAFLREGYRKNPHSARLIAEMGRIYSEKLGRSQEAFYYRDRVKQEEGRSTFLIAYEWYDLARKVGDQYGVSSRGLSKPVLYSQACHNLSYYAQELTQETYDAFKASLEARDAGRETEAREAFDRAVAHLAKAVDAWAWARREWRDHILQFEKEPTPAVLLEVYRKFYRQAGTFHHNLGGMLEHVTYTNLPTWFERMERPEIT